ncbi:MAG TPA: L,D-transpeptidase family protein [Thermoanaerobaculia bacterium]|jgi:murein L,D-transpeptidase YcbB/YkuD|nr:L,D-transpeptidase family protein [Thermoanaerobaculia bacterium]
MKRLSLVLALLATVSLSAQTVDITPATPVAKLIRSLVDGSSSDLRNVYAPAGYALLWTSNGRPTAQAQTVIAQLQNASVKGLDATDYDGGQWTSRIANLRGDAALAQFDVALTTSVLQYTSDLRLGRVNPREVRFDFDNASKKLYAPMFVAQLATSNDPASMFANVEPKHDEYRNLIAALATYRRIEAASTDDAALPIVTKLTRGQTYEALPRMATRLRLLGDLDANTIVEGTTYDGAIVDAVKHFQSRHGLDADGVIGKTTFAQLNVPVSQRVQQIEWAIERWRWVPEDEEASSIIVNIPEFKLRARHAQGGEELSMRVVVGKAAGHKTPVFDGDIKHVVFRPYWSVPPSIQRGEILPKLERDGSYLERNRYELVDASGRSAGTNVDAETLRRVRNGSLSVRQKPGTSNALGLVKFLFPNDNNVYLHSTPQQALFARSRRDFSHGCIRVEDPVALAEWTLQGQDEWSKEKIKATIGGKKDDVYVKIQRPIIVTIMYATAAASSNGEVQFFDDIYGHDTQLAKVLMPEQQGAPVMVAAK